MKKTLVLMMGIGWVAAGVSIAGAQPPGEKGRFFRHDGKPHFAKMDVDKDGNVTREEMLEAVRKRWSDADVDQDGRVGLEEMRGRRQAKKAERFAKKDSNGDGLLSAEELPRMPQRVFKRLDKDGDGLLSTDELAAKRKGHRRPGKFFERLDADGDGYVTLAEVEAHAASRFEKLDANGDGVIDRDEMKRGRKGRHHGPKGQRGPKGQGRGKKS